MKKKIKILILLGMPLLSNAGGFQINTQSIKGTGMGGAYAGVCHDASGVYFNPGSIVFMEKNSFTLGDALIMPVSSYLSPYDGNVDMKKQLFFPPQLYGNYRLKDKIALGLSVNTPYGLGSKWDDTWTGRYVTQQVTLRTFYIQPTVSYLVSKNVGLGAGLVFTSGHANVQKAQQAGNNDIHAVLDGGGTGFGFNAGVFAKLGDKARIGVDYHSQVKVKLNNGDATFSNVPSSLAGEVPGSTKFNSQITFPSELSGGISYEITPQILASVEFNYTGWNVYDSLNFDFPDYPSLNARNGRLYKNTSTFRIGVEWKAKEKITLRAGAALDQSPVQDNYVSPELPDADKQSFSAGISYKYSAKLSIDVCYMYENFDERKGEYIQEQFGGSYKTIVNIIGLGINYSW